MDIEGNELDWLPYLVDGASQSTQISFELHLKRAHSTRKIEQRYGGHPDTSPWYARLMTFSGIAHLMQMLWDKGGYTLVHRRDNRQHNSCSDLLINRDRM